MRVKRCHMLVLLAFSLTLSSLGVAAIEPTPRTTPTKAARDDRPDCGPLDLSGDQMRRAVERRQKPGAPMLEGEAALHAIEDEYNCRWYEPIESGAGTGLIELLERGGGASRRGKR
jgi:hypothetical protein